MAISKIHPNLDLRIIVILVSLTILFPGLVYAYYHQDYQLLESPLWLVAENEIHVINVYIMVPPDHNLLEDVKNNVFYALNMHMHVIPLFLVEKFPEDSINNKETGCINGKVYGCITGENILIINGHQGDLVGNGNESLSSHLIQRVYDKEMLW